jgi:hypothetical protein
MLSRGDRSLAHICGHIARPTTYALGPKIKLVLGVQAHRVSDEVTSNPVIIVMSIRIEKKKKKMTTRRDQSTG